MAFEFEPLSGAAWRNETAKLGKETWHRVHEPSLAIDVVIRLGVGPTGRLGCTGLLLGSSDDNEVTARSLRTVPLGEIMTAVASYIAGGDDKSPLARAVQKHYAETVLRDTAGGMSGRRQRPGPRGWDDDHYKRVVAAYREALLTAPRSPIPETARLVHSTPSTVRRWLKTARDRGIAGASSPGQAGEVQGDE